MLVMGVVVLGGREEKWKPVGRQVEVADVRWRRLTAIGGEEVFW